MNSTATTMSAAHADEVLPPAAVRWCGLVAGPIAALTVWVLLARDADATVAPEAVTSLSREGAIVLALIVWMAVWWLTQAVELSTTALLPLLVLPLTGVTRSVGEAAAPFANEVIFLFAGGCLLATALERHGISRRMALLMLALAGPRPALIVGVFMLASALLSAFVSNTATVAMMLPLGMAAVLHAERTAPDQTNRERRVMLFGTAVLLAIAYGANIGGAATLIGSPPNAIAAQLLNEGRSEAERITFVGWLSFAAPTVGVFLPLTWALLCFVLVPVRSLELRRDPGAQGQGARSSETMEPLSRAAWFTLAVFLVAVCMWITMPWLPGSLRSLRDAGVAVLAGMLLLLVPLGRDPSSTALSWRDAAKLPWGVFVLFGGGLAIAAAMERHGVAIWLGRAFHDLAGSPEILIIGAIVLAILFLTEVASNTAIAATTIPILLALGPAVGIPVEKLVLPAAFAASWAFMLPVGTPPNALVFSTGRIPAMTMARVGLVLNLVAIVVITLAAMILL